MMMGRYYHREIGNENRPLIPGKSLYRLRNPHWNEAGCELSAELLFRFLMIFVTLPEDMNK